MPKRFCPKRGGNISADIDIDFADRQKVLDLVKTRSASMIHQGQMRRHNSGVYVTDIPWNPVTQCAAIDYETAESRGYFKIDFLNVSVYQLIKDSDHYQQMIDRTPPWSRLWKDPEWASNLVHVGGHTDLLASMRPDSIPRMAAFISLIRPGKAHLQNQPWDRVFASVWDGDNSRGFVFKKSHAIGYAHLVCLHMNLLDFSD
jgi:hypothetical protein